MTFFLLKPVFTVLSYQNESELIIWDRYLSEHWLIKYEKKCPVKFCVRAHTNKKLNNNPKINTEYFLTLDSYSQK